MKALALLLTLLAAASAAFAGGVVVYEAYPPIQAAVGMDRYNVVPGGQVHLRAAAPFGVVSGNVVSLGGPAYDQDARYVDGNYAELVDDPVHVTSWQVKDQNGVSGGIVTATGALTATWTAPAGLSSYPATYTVTMVVDDYATYGGSSNDSPVTRTATVVVSPVNPVGYLSARPTGSAGIQLDWNAPEGGATSYKIYRRTDPNTAYAGLPVHQSTTTSWTDTDVTQGTTYYYHIQATNGGNDGPMSPEVIGTPEAEQPTAVAYVANSLANNVLVVDTMTDQVYATIAIGKTFAEPGSIGPLGVAVSPDGSRVYVTNMKQETVSIIEAATNRELDIDGNSATADPLDSPPGISRVKLRTTEDVSQPLLPDGVLVSPDGQSVFVANFMGGSDANRSGSIAFIDTSDNSVSKPVPNGITHPTRMALTPDGATLYAPNASRTSGQNNDVVAVNISDPTLQPVTISLPSGNSQRPQGIAIAQTANGTRAYIVNSMGQSVSVIDTASNSVVGTITIPFEPSISSLAPYPLEAAASEDGAYVFVTGSQPGAGGHSYSVAWVIDTSSNTVVAREALVDGTQPLYGAGRIAVMSDGAGYKVYITNFGDFLPGSKGKRVSSLTWALDEYLQYELMQNPTIHTGDDSGPGGITIRPDYPVKPTNLKAVASGQDTVSGQGSITLYWNSIPGVKGYNVYRGTSAGMHPVRINGNQPSNQPSYQDGILTSNVYWYNDQDVVDGLTYYYVVKGVGASGAETQSSNEDNDTADNSAIPWHTGDAYQITYAVEQAAAAIGETLGDSLRVLGPDGRVYDTEEGATGPDGLPSPDTNLFDLPDGTDIAVPWEPIYKDESHGQGQGSSLYKIPKTGPFHRLHSSPGFRKVTQQVQLPETYQLAQVPYPWSYYRTRRIPGQEPQTVLQIGSSDVPFIYLGSTYDYGKAEIDAGLMYQSGIWKVVVWNHDAPGAIAICRPEEDPYTGDPIKGFSPGTTVNMSYAIAPQLKSNKRITLLTVDNFSGSGLQTPTSCSVASFSRQMNDLSKVTMKRVVSFGQNLDPVSLAGAVFGYHSSGSHMLIPQINNVRLFLPGASSGTNWTPYPLTTELTNLPATGRGITYQFVKQYWYETNLTIDLRNMNP